MSSIYFHAKDGEASIRGSERAYFGIFCSDITWDVIKRIAEETRERRSILRETFPPGHYALTAGDFKEMAHLHFRVGDGRLTLGEKQIDLFDLALNTAIALGSDPVKLCARLHGQSELHTYVEGCNREWLAGIIEQGRESKFFRDNAGWESVVGLLRKDDASPVVTSYSASDVFPNVTVANFIPPLVDGEKDRDAWYELSEEVRWEMAITGLRESSETKWLEMKPEKWNDYFFGDGINAIQFVDELRKLHSERERSTP